MATQRIGCGRMVGTPDVQPTALTKFEFLAELAHTFCYVWERDKQSRVQRRDLTKRKWFKRECLARLVDVGLPPERQAGAILLQSSEALQVNEFDSGLGTRDEKIVEAAGAGITVPVPKHLQRRKPKSFVNMNEARKRAQPITKSTCEAHGQEAELPLGWYATYLIAKRDHRETHDKHSLESHCSVGRCGSLTVSVTLDNRDKARAHGQVGH